MFIILTAWKSCVKANAPLFLKSRSIQLCRRLLPVSLFQNILLDHQSLSALLRTFRNPACKNDGTFARSMVCQKGSCGQAKRKHVDVRVAQNGHLGCAWALIRDVCRWSNEWGCCKGARASQEPNPRLRPPLPYPPQTHFLVAWSTLRRNSPGTDSGAALLLHCEWSGLHLGRSERKQYKKTPVCVCKSFF